MNDISEGGTSLIYAIHVTLVGQPNQNAPMAGHVAGMRETKMCTEFS
jgi:hypothetical protein